MVCGGPREGNNCKFNQQVEWTFGNRLSVNRFMSGNSRINRATHWVTWIRTRLIIGTLPQRTV